MRDGELMPGKWGHVRWCASCGQPHGPLYICEHYSPELKVQIQAESDAFVANLNDPAWVRQQLDDGVPPEAIAAMCLFAPSLPVPPCPATFTTEDGRVLACIYTGPHEEHCARDLGSVREWRGTAPS